MKPVRIAVLGVAAVSAVGLAVIVRGAVSGEPTSRAVAGAPQAPAAPTTRVLVAKRDLKVGERLSDADMEWRDWPLDSVHESFVTDGRVPVPTLNTNNDPNAPSAEVRAAQAIAPDGGAVAKVTRTLEDMQGGGPKAAFVGAVVREPLGAGEPIVDRKLVRAGESGFMAVVLQPGMRAMAVPVSVESAAGGFILPGDRVDVVQSRQVEVPLANGSSRSEHVSGTVLRNVKVLAIDQVTQPDKDATTVVGATATLELKPGDAEALALARAQGTLSLILRSYADADGPSGRALTLASTASSSSGPPAHTVRVFRDGQAEDVAVRP